MDQRLSEEQALSVSDFLSITADGLKKFGSFMLCGEISQFSLRNHLYFTLKDQNSAVDCIMFSSALRRLPFTPEIGQRVVLTGECGLYKKTGRFSVTAHRMELAGIGRIMAALQDLQFRLRNEGVFNRPANIFRPQIFKRIGVVTSAQGRACFDIIENVRRRNPLLSLFLFDTMVQGAGAAASIVASLMRAYDFAARHGLDAVIVGRGGGSFEDLLCFSDERVVRAVAASPVYIISAVGHDEDRPLCDYAADIRVSTPTGAAEFVTGVTLDDILAYLARLRDLICNCMESRLDFLSERTERCSAVLSRSASIRNSLASRDQELFGIWLRMSHAVAGRANALALRLERLDGFFERDLFSSDLLRFDSALERLKNRLDSALYRRLERLSRSLDDSLRSLLKDRYSAKLGALSVAVAHMQHSMLESLPARLEALNESSDRLGDGMTRALTGRANALVLRFERLEGFFARDTFSSDLLRLDSALERLKTRLDSALDRRLECVSRSLDDSLRSLLKDRYSARLGALSVAVAHLRHAMLESLPARLESLNERSVRLGDRMRPDALLLRLKECEGALDRTRAAFYAASERAIPQRLAAMAHSLDAAAMRLELLNPLTQLKRNLTLTLNPDFSAVSIASLQSGDEVVTVTRDGMFTSTVRSVTAHADIAELLKRRGAKSS